MADNVTLPGTGAVARSRENPDGSHSQGVLVEYDAADGSEGIRVSEATPLPVTTNDEVFTITPSFNTSAHAVGDTLFDAQQIASVGLATGKPVTLVSVCATDADNITPPAGLVLFFFDRSVTFGTANAAPSISDADAAHFVGRVDIVVADWVDLGGVAVACPVFNPILMKPNATDLYVSSMTTGTPTPTSGIAFKLGFAR